jgi:hypothetical protein
MQNKKIKVVEVFKSKSAEEIEKNLRIKIVSLMIKRLRLEAEAV